MAKKAVEGKNPQWDNFIDNLINPALADMSADSIERFDERLQGLGRINRMVLTVLVREQIAVEQDENRAEKLQILLDRIQGVRESQGESGAVVLTSDDDPDDDDPDDEDSDDDSDPTDDDPEDY